MKKNEFFFAILTLALYGCSDPQRPARFISAWDSPESTQAVLERKIASLPTGQCLKDLYSVETLQAEIHLEEKKYQAARPIEGQWKHLDLARLPIPQANFLNAHGNKVGDLAYPGRTDYSSCKDVPCVFNQVYGRPDHVAGYVHYLWYLKFGHLLSADNLVPGQNSKVPGVYNGKNFSLASYLYSDDELYGFWRLSHMLESPFTELAYLDEIQRLPRGENFEQKELQGTCGAASSDGYIVLGDGCLTLNQNRDQGHLYQGILHELAHQLDFEEGKGSGHFYRSHQKDYLEVSGMYLEEYQAKSLVQTWKILNKDNLVSEYASVTPEENFAETVAYLRMSPENALLNLSEKHFEFVSEKYFNNASFSYSDQFSDWQNKRYADLTKWVVKAVLECRQTSDARTSNFFTAADFKTSVGPGLMNCYGAYAEEIGARLLSMVKLKEPEGCVATLERSRKLTWNSLLRPKLVSLFKKNHTLGLLTFNFYDALVKSRAARDAYLICQGEIAAETCFDEEVRKKALEQALVLKLSHAEIKDLVDLYISVNDFSKIQSQTRATYQSYVLTRSEDIKKTSEALWGRCKGTNPNDDLPPKGQHFTLTDGYLISSIYSCLNQQFKDTVALVIDGFSLEGLKVEANDERIIFEKIVTPYLQKNLKEIYRREQTAELLSATEFMRINSGKLRERLQVDFGWTGEVVDLKKLQSDCRNRSLALINFSPAYHLKKDLFGPFISGSVCWKIQESERFQRWLRSSELALKP
ncbi:MAG TPA: zinc-dependent peptidase [Bacteriovoracaceae bacterium]|nr:zinc-dependent peptidase [Bacteriovoracaceae bacterium]